METLVRCLRSGLQPLLRLIYKYYLRLEIHRAPELQPGHVYLFCSNHSSHLDSLAIIYGSGLSEKLFAATAAHDYFFSSPFKMNLFKLFVNIVPLKRNPSYKQVKENLRSIHQQMVQGKNIIFFPEGTRSPDGTIHCFKKGLGFIAQELKIPIVPVYIEGTHRSLPKGKWLIRPVRLKISFGNPIDIHLRCNHSSEDITCAVHAEVMSLSQRGHRPECVLDQSVQHKPAIKPSYASSSLKSELKRTESQVVNS